MEKKFNNSLAIGLSNLKPRKEKLKILMVGMHDTNNQYARNILEANKMLPNHEIELIHVDGIKNTRIPLDAEALMVIIRQISHQKSREAMNIYRDQGKPVFVVTAGWVDVREGFDNWIFSYQGNTKQETPMPQIVDKPKFIIPVKYKTQVVQTGNTKRFHPDTKEEILRIVNDCWVVGKMSVHETLEYLKAEGWNRIDGKDFNTADVYNFGAELKRKIQKSAPPKKPAKVKEVSPVTSVKTTPVESNPPKENVKDVIAGIMTHDKFTDKERLDLIAKVVAGEKVNLSTTELVKNSDGSLEIIEDHILNGKTSLMKLTPFQHALLIKHREEI